ncbi:protein SSUH2 [Nephila pilipes]|uniref:Protein SSUH2 n=1 Tax=Nephila pilipes TaxID=299642 RepID=A0A8X6PGS2_NEPPI|nr:protein SSUH2 [Nephila pilipes]
MSKYTSLPPEQNFEAPPANSAPYPNYPFGINTPYPASPTGSNTPYPTSPTSSNAPYPTNITGSNTYPTSPSGNNTYPTSPSGNNTNPNYPPCNNTPYPASYYPTHTGYPSQQPQIMDYPNPGVPQPGTVPQNYPQPGTIPQNYPQPGVFPQPGISGDCPVPGGTGISQPPTAPDLSQIQKIPGYEGITLDYAVLEPPSFPTWEPTDQNRKPVENLPALTEEEVHAAVTEYASEHCCYGSAVARDMQVKEIVMMSAFHYKLETYAEKRESAYCFEPYKGQPIDGPANGPAPPPWDIQATPPGDFKCGKSKFEVPHTAFVKPCHTCVGNSRVICKDCQGNGRKQCTWCKGRGRRSQFDQEEICTSCNGTGFDRCTWCSGTGQVKCKTCDGKGNLKGFVELTVTWTNHVDDYVSETSFPKELILKVQGQVAYEEVNPRVFPINHVYDAALCNASKDFVHRHTTGFPNERILKQRQLLRVIPIGSVKYQWKDRMDEFFVYGYEHKVYFKDYPQKCCCCTIL